MTNDIAVTLSPLQNVPDEAAPGIDAIYSLRITRSRRATAYRRK